MSTLAIRPAMVPVSRRVRAYFAPMNRSTEAASLFDPGKYGAFPLDTPPSPWLDLGWIDNFQRMSLTSVEPLRSGLRGAAGAQYRGPLDARLEFDFREWGKLQMALAGGSEHMNVLASDPNANAQPSGGAPLAAVAVLSGSTASQVIVGAGAVAGFSVGDIIAVDADYQQQVGYVGAGIAGAYVSTAAAVNNDPNYIRRVTFNVGRVVQITATALLLAQPLLGGAPQAGWNVQKIIAFVDREGGGFFQEWSALFIAEEENGGRICFHYPRLSPASSLKSAPANALAALQREQSIAISKPIAALALHAAFTALPHTDENDGQIALCYRSYFLASGAALY